MRISWTQHRIPEQLLNISDQPQTIKRIPGVIKGASVQLMEAGTKTSSKFQYNYSSLFLGHSASAV